MMSFKDGSEPLITKRFVFVDLESICMPVYLSPVLVTKVQLCKLVSFKLVRQGGTIF